MLQLVFGWPADAAKNIKNVWQMPCPVDTFTLFTLTNALVFQRLGFSPKDSASEAMILGKDLNQCGWTPRKYVYVTWILARAHTCNYCIMCTLYIYIHTHTSKCQHSGPNLKLFDCQKHRMTSSMNHLTVREQLYYSARLRNAEGTPPAMINNIVEDVLNVMQLLDVQHSLVGDVEKRGISRFGFYVSDDVSPMGALRLRHGYVCGNLQGQGVHQQEPAPLK